MPASRADRKFMEMAVEKMRQSRSEHANERDPLVGAVLVSGEGKLLGATHRGDLRVGDHAEFTLIERYLKDKQLEGATLYVTLEPCTRRNPPKTPCANRVVNARIRRVFIGMTDPNPDIQGRGVQYLLDNGVEVDFFDNDFGRQIMEANRNFRAYWESAERLATNAEPFEGPSGKELEVVERASVDDFSQEALKRYVSQCKLSVPVPSKELSKILERAGHLGRATNGKLTPTLAGLVLFATRPSEILPQCRVSMEAKKAGRTIPANFEGPLMAFRDHLDNFFKDHMRHFKEIRGLDRVSVGEYPMEAIREAAFNAVVHRDYQAGARVHITLDETEIEVRSPGGLLKPLSLIRIRAFNAPPYSRNPHIALALERMDWIEEKGSGLKRMRDTMLARGLRPPMFDFADGYFVVRLPGSEQAWANVRVAAENLANLGAHEKTIINLVTTRGRLGTTECAKKLRVSLATARRHLGELVNKGFLEQRGRGPTLSYYLAGSE